MKKMFPAALGAALMMTATVAVNAQSQRGDRHIDPVQSLGRSNTTQQSASSGGSLAGPAPTCTKVVTNPLINGTSGNGRAPTTNFQFIRTHYLITQAELAAAGYTNGAMPTVIGWVYSTANNGGTAPLKIWMENTSDTTNNKSATWDDAIVGMTLVHDAATTLPAVVGATDITLTGGSPFTYTGDGLYIAFDWGQFTPNGTGAVISCNTNLAGGLKGQQSNVSAPTTLATSAFRPITRLNGVALLNDAAVTQIQAMGVLAPCLVPAQIIRAVVTNNGTNTLTNVPVTLNISGADVFTDTQNLASIDPCGGTGVVTFLAYTPNALGNNVISVSVPDDTVNGNNVQTRNLDNTTNDISHKYPGSTASGGVGFTGGVGAFVAKFTTTAADTITHVNLEFPGTTPPATTYRVVVYGDNAGVPSTTVLYLDSADRAVLANGPVTIALDTPVAVGPGDFYVGLQQTNTVNAGFSYDTETPIRPAMFFFAAQLPATTWVDFAPNNSFKLNVGIVVQDGCASIPCPADINDDGQVNVTDLLAVIGAWGACPAPCPPDINTDGEVNVTDLLAVIGAWGACP